MQYTQLSIKPMNYGQKLTGSYPASDYFSFISLPNISHKRHHPKKKQLT